jgi:phosphate transport system substrate-binding protein
VHPHLKIPATVCALTVAIAALAGCGSDSREESQITVTGSTTILPIAEIAGEQFEEANPDLRVFVSGLGSSAGIESVSSGSSDIGSSSRELKDEELDLDLVDTPIAYDAIAVIVHPDNPLDELTTEQIRSVFAGEVSNWSELGGADVEIGIVNRDEASGTREAFSKIVLDGGRFDPAAAILPGTGQVRSVVADSVGAIGYISLGFVTPEVKALDVDGVAATRANVIDSTYPIRRLLHFFTVGPPEGAAADYVDYVLSPEVQEGVVADAGFIPYAAERD